MHGIHDDNKGTAGRATGGTSGTKTAGRIGRARAGNWGITSADSGARAVKFVDLCAMQAPSVKELGISELLSGLPFTKTLAPQNGSGEDHPPIVVHPTTSTSTATFGSEEEGGIVMHAPPGTSTRDCRATQRASVSWGTQDETTVSIPMYRPPETNACELQKISNTRVITKEEQYEEATPMHTTVSPVPAALTLQPEAYKVASVALTEEYEAIPMHTTNEFPLAAILHPVAYTRAFLTVNVELEETEAEAMPMLATHLHPAVVAAVTVDSEAYSATACARAFDCCGP